MRANHLIATAAAAVVMVASASTASADEGRTPVGNGTGGGWIPGQEPQYTSDEVAATQAKLDVMAGYADLASGQLSLEDFRRLERRASQQVGVELHVPVVDLVEDLLEPERSVLPVKHAGQRQNYYCGPAAGLMIARFLHAKVSAANGESLDQRSLAGPAHMKTTRYGLTSWASGLFTTGLNTWLRGNGTGYYNQIGSPSPTQFRQALGYDIADGHPFAADTVEFAGGAHYNFHPQGQTIGHWVVVRGYTRDRDRTAFLDPATTVWPEAHESFSRATNPFVSTFLGTNGISG